MAIVSVNFNKVSADKKSAVTGKIGVSNNVALNSLEEADVKTSPENTSLKIGFKFKSEYTPDTAVIEIEGDLIMIEPKATADEFLTKWGSDKQLPKEAMINVYNAVMHKCFVVAIMLTKELNLPAPIRFPRVTEKIAEA